MVHRPKSRISAGRHAHSLARTTKGGKGRIKKRSSYKKRMKTGYSKD